MVRTVICLLVVTGVPPMRRFMFSRYDRDRLAEVINLYLSEELTAFRFDEQLSEIAAGTKDETVKQVVSLFWYHYDDIDDHKVVASKEEWHYFQRLLLILKSDADIVSQSGMRKWTMRQAVAAVCVAIFVVVLVRTGFGSHLFLATAPLGLVSMLLWQWRSSAEARSAHEQTAIQPFGSLPELLSVRRKVRCFVKARYPVRLGSRQIRGPVGEAANWLHFALGLMLFSPVVLIFQSFPEKEQRLKVIGTQLPECGCRA